MTNPVHLLSVAALLLVAFLVGAAIGTATGHLITTRENDRVQIFPWGSTNGAGVDVSLRF